MTPPAFRCASGFSARVVSLAACAALSAGCSIERLAINRLADTLAESSAVYTGDDDPELVRDAFPFTLKTIETLLARAPDHPGLLLAACQGFVRYSYAFVELEAERLELDDYAASERLRTRARKLYRRGRDYCLQGLELASPGVGRRLVQSPREALGDEVGDVALTYWTGASWGALIAISLDQPELVVDLPAVRALLAHALTLDEGYDDGIIHEALITLEALPEAMGGSPARARAHFERAAELSGGTRAGLYVAYAASVAVAEQDRRLFEALLQNALAIDVAKRPDERLVNLVLQARARLLRERVDDLFFADDPGDQEPPPDIP